MRSHNTNPAHVFKSHYNFIHLCGFNPVWDNTNWDTALYGVADRTDEHNTQFYFVVLDESYTWL